MWRRNLFRWSCRRFCSWRWRVFFNVASHQSFSVGVKGRPRSPLKSFFSRRSLELLLRRLMPGATNWLLSRRARRPFSQSSQLIEPSIGMQGIFDFKFIGNFFHQLLTLWKITIFRQIRHNDFFKAPRERSFSCGVPMEMRIHSGN